MQEITVRGPPSEEYLSIARLKRRVVRDYPPAAGIRLVLQAEPDTMSRDELLAKLGGWVVLIRAAEEQANATRAIR